MNHPLIPRSWLSFVGGAMAGAGMSYFLDPTRGHRRRVILRDRLFAAARRQRRLADKGARDLEHRAEGMVARVRGSLRREHVDDERLVDRVRSQMGRVVAHPSSIDVHCKNGVVVLSGPVFREELQHLLRRVRKVPGVRAVEHRLELHDSADGVPGLQGRGSTASQLANRGVWPPWMRLVTTAAGAVAGIAGLRRGGITGTAIAIAGSTAALRAMSNVPVREFVSHRRLVLHKAIDIAAPVDEVFDFWSRFENFPRFMRHVHAVDVTGDGRRSHWKVQGPGGSTLTWEAERTAFVPSEIIAWRTVPGSLVEHAGSVHFEPDGDDGTRLMIQMSYEQPAGVLGHVAARLFRSDPKQAMDDDLGRLKTLLEEGQTRSPDGRRVRVEDMH